MNHSNNENKAPITRVFNLSGLRKNSQRSLDTNNSTPTNETLPTLSTPSKNPVEPPQPPTVDTNDYKTRDFNFSFKNYKNQNENIKLSATSPTTSSSTLLVSSNAENQNSIISQHRSEIDIDDRYVSKKVNPVYKSDSEDEDKKKDIDFCDYSAVYQEPTELHTAIMTDNMKNLSFKTNRNQSNINNDEIYATINENDLYLTPIELNLDLNEQKGSVKEQYVRILSLFKTPERIQIVFF
jgi:hypothetical protein